jgi:hypothetical protein
VQSALLGIDPQARTPVRLAAAEQIGTAAADQIRDDLREFARLGGFTLRPGSTPWFGAALRTADDVRHACDLASRLGTHTVGMLTSRVGRAAAGCGLQAPGCYAEAMATVRLFGGIRRTLCVLAPGVYAARPQALAAAVGGGNEVALGLRERRALRRRAGELWTGADRPEPAELAAALTEAARQLAQWQRLAGLAGGAAADPGAAGNSAAGNGAAALPQLPDDLGELDQLCDDCSRQLTALRGYLPVPDDGLEGTLTALTADTGTAWKLPRLYELAGRFDELGPGPLLDDICRRPVTPDLAVAVFEHAWYSSIRDQIRVRDPRYAAAYSDALDDIAGDFQTRDVQYLAANRRQVRSDWAQRLREAADRHPLQARVIRKQAALRRGHLPLRRLLDQTGDVLFALKPCWAMSPLMVSQVLPAARLFDVVIFDEASQIVPADAIPSIMRGHQIVVAGDDRQLPPTNFFRQVADGDDELAEEEEENLVSFGAGSGGTAAAASGAAELNPFEADVRDRLAECGITVVPQYGVGGYRVDFAAAHPDDAGRMVLAIEADGASYRESGSVRDRDRLRGEHLQRLAGRRRLATPCSSGLAGPCRYSQAAAVKMTVTCRKPSECSIPFSMLRVLTSASAISGLCRAAPEIFCCARM